jgi:hypothetical protein
LLADCSDFGFASVVWVFAVGAMACYTLPEKVVMFDDLPETPSNPPPPGFTLDAPAKPQAAKPPFDPSKPYEVVPDWARDTPPNAFCEYTEMTHSLAWERGTLVVGHFCDYPKNAY